MSARALLYFVNYKGTVHMVVAVHLDSPGKTLYRVIKKRSGIFVSLMHGVNIIRHSVSLCDQGIRHLSTVFVLPVMGEGGGRTRLGIHIQYIW